MEIKIKVPVGAQLVVDWDQDAGDGPSLVGGEAAELSAWRKAANEAGFDSPEDLASMQGANFGQFADKRIVKEWQTATQCKTPELASARFVGHIDTVDGQAKRIGTLLDERQQWREQTNCDTPKQAKNSIDTLYAIDIDRATRAKDDTRAWQKATGATDPANAVNVLAAERDAIRLEWQESTGAMNPTAASKRVHDLEAQLLSCAGEIDALRKGNAQPLVSDTVSGREHAKVKAELQSKCREAQTNWERANRAELESQARGLILESIGAALASTTPILWDPIPRLVAGLKQDRDSEFKRRVDAETHLHKIDEVQHEFTRMRPGYAQLANVIQGAWVNAKASCENLSAEMQRQSERASTAESMFRVEQKKRDDEKQQNIAQADELSKLRDLLTKTCEALGVEKFDDLPGAAESLMELIESDTVNRVFSSEDLAQETTDIAEILTAQLKDAGIVSAAQTIACRTASYSKANTLAMEARKTLGAKTGENVLGAAKRLMATALVPLPKPDKVKTGQRWAVLHDIVWTGKAGPENAQFNGADSKVQRLDTDGILRLEHWIYLGT